MRTYTVTKYDPEDYAALDNMSKAEVIELLENQLDAQETVRLLQRQGAGRGGIQPLEILQGAGFSREVAQGGGA